MKRPRRGSMETVKLDLNIHAQAWAILHLLAPHTDLVQKGINIQTTTLYSGRERGFCVTVHDHLRAIHIWFCEYRNSDSIVVREWNAVMGLNPPTANDVPDSAYDTEVGFKYNETHDAAERIKDLIVAAGCILENAKRTPK